MTIVQPSRPGRVRQDSFWEGPKGEHMCIIGRATQSISKHLFNRLYYITGIRAQISYLRPQDSSFCDSAFCDLGFL
jgi:hypothetical protein